METASAKRKPSKEVVEPSSTQSSRGPTSAVPDRDQSIKVKTLLVPVDFSHASMQAVNYAVRLAKKFDATIHLGHVHPPDEASPVPGAGHLMLKCAEAITFLRNRSAEDQRKDAGPFWPRNCHVRTGRPFVEICELAASLNADLIILATRGYSGLKHVLLGSTAERVVRYAPCPVFVCRPRKHDVQTAVSDASSANAELVLRKILVPVDFSECSMAGVRYAAFFARIFNAKLRLFHAIYPHSNVVVDRVTYDLASVQAAERSAAKEQMKALREISFLQGISCETEVRVGSAIEEICGETAHPEVDLVIMATHGHTGFKHVLIGSVAEHVVRYSECPAMTVPSRSIGSPKGEAA